MTIAPPTRMSAGPTRPMRRLAAVPAAIGALLLLAAAGGAQEVAPSPRGEAPSRERGWIGFSFRLLDADGREIRAIAGRPPDGGTVVVREVMPGSPAEKAGIVPGDTLLRIDGEEASPARFLRFARELEPEERVRLALRREGRTREVLVVAGRRPMPPPPPVVGFSRVDSVRNAIRRSIDSVRIHLRGAEIRADSTRVRLDSAVVEVRPGRSTLLRVRPGGGIVRLDTTRIDSAQKALVRLYKLRLDSTLEARFELERRLPERSDSLLPSEPGTEGEGASARLLSGDSLRVALLRPDPDVREEGFEVTTSLLAPYVAGRSVVAGAQVTELNPELGEYFRAEEGLLVTRILPETPAADAGLRGGDVIVGVEEAAVATIEELRRRLASRHREAVLRVVREGETLRIPLRR